MLKQSERENGSLEKKSLGKPWAVGKMCEQSFGVQLLFNSFHCHFTNI